MITQTENNFNTSLLISSGIPVASYKPEHGIKRIKKD